MKTLRITLTRHRIQLFAACCLTVLPLSGAPINVFGTGLDSSRNLLPGGSADAHWTLTMGGSVAYVAQGATAAESGTNGVPVGWPLIPGQWVTSSFAQWIAPVADVVSITGSGEYDYQTTFFVAPGSSNELTGNWSTDNLALGIYLNGNLLPNTTPSGTPAFHYLTSFDITSGFVPGVNNTLSFHVQNSSLHNTFPAPNPTGLLVEISGTSTTALAPEPGTMLVAGFGLALAGLAYRRRRREQVPLTAGSQPGSIHNVRTP
jgi:PEP-CTERM motif